MFTVYPTNRLEHLSELLHAVITAQPSDVFAADTVLVENPGMQHWLQMRMATAATGAQISMNVDFPLTARFVWDVARAVLGDDAIRPQSPYRREVLQFSIVALLQSEELLNDPACEPVVRYWQSADSATQQAQRRLNLAIALADAYEQYSLFRPDWLAAWEAGNELIGNSKERWQALIWRMLVAQCGPHPADLLTKTSQLLRQTESSQEYKALLPKRIFLFAINALAPQLLDLFDALALHCDVHFFHLNPSQAFWGDIQSQRAIAHAIRQPEQMTVDEGNPLLANLGQQGKDLLNRLVQINSLEIAAYEQPQQGAEQPSLLSQIQEDIFQARKPSPWAGQVDQSIALVSCHTALREVQTLHDHLLHIIADNPDIKARDIIVLCPEIEQYAPYVYSVFARPGSQAQDTQNKGQPVLPCSLSDRRSKDTDPLISTFLSLLSLPDARFSASEVLAYLDQPVVYKKMGMAEEDIEVITSWVDKTCIRWGLDASHKARQADVGQASAQNSWEWGLKRLLTGLLAPDSALITDGLLTVPNVEGQQSLLLGKLIGFIHKLYDQSRAMRKPRTMAKWVELLQDLCQQWFAEREAATASWEALMRAIAGLSANATEAGMQIELTLQEVQILLEQQFSRADVSNHFLTGNVTFCSMMPMRSIPFKVVAVLGLNDEYFPRKDTQISLNLMHDSRPRLGDRSRAKEDRYLFLEALMSARQYLYLSYQGANVRDNTERQPSSVLTQFMRTLSEYYQLDMPVRQAPLHSYSPDNFRAPWLSFDASRFRLAEQLWQGSKEKPVQFKPVATDAPQPWTIESAVACLVDPLAYFARNALGVSADIHYNPLEDDEPFTGDSLTRYLALDDAMHMDFTDIEPRIRLSGVLPDNEIGADYLTNWRTGADLLQTALAQHQGESQQVALVLEHFDQDPQHSLVINGQAELIGQQQILVLPGKRTHKQLLLSWLKHLLLHANQHNGVTTIVYFLEWSAEIELKQFTFAPLGAEQVEASVAALQGLLRKLSHSPTLAHSALGQAVVETFDPEQGVDNSALVDKFATLLAGNDKAAGIAESPYFSWFFGSESDPETILPSAETLSLLREFYQPFIKVRNAKVKL